MGRVAPTEMDSESVRHIAMAEATHSVANSDTVDRVSAGDAIGDEPPNELASDAVERVESGDAEPTKVVSDTVTRVASRYLFGEGSIADAFSGTALNRRVASGRTDMTWNSGCGSRGEESEQHVLDIPSLRKRSRREDNPDGRCIELA